MYGLVVNIRARQVLVMILFRVTLQEMSVSPVNVAKSDLSQSVSV